MAARIHVFDGDPAARAELERAIGGEGWSVAAAGDAADELRLLASAPPPDLVVGGAERGGLEALEALRAAAPDTPVLLVADDSSIVDAVQAIQRGAFDYVSRSGGWEAVAVAAGRALRHRALVIENRALRRDLREKYRLDDVVGRSDAMLEVFKTAARVAATNAAVLLAGERGTGRERVARAVHQASPRSSAPFVVCDCAALPGAVLEAELFGEPTLPGASPARALLEDARGGTLYLASVGRMGPSVQLRLSRALDEPVAAEQQDAARLDVRIIASTDEDLHAAAREGRFREDLLYRLDVVAIAIPALRDRREDIPLLVEHFAAKHGSGRAAVSPAAMDLLVGHDWPGNVRELENAVARAFALCTAGVVMPDDLPPRLRESHPRGPLKGGPGRRPTLAQLDREYAAEVLRETRGNKTRAAEILGIDRKTLYRLLEDSNVSARASAVGGGVIRVR
jgi:DNA-binding NtrC family response regulator